MKKIEYEKFRQKFEQLIAINPHYEKIIFETMRRLEKNYSIPEKSHFKENFQKYKKANAITYEEIANELSKRYKLEVDADTLKSYGRKERKTLSSSYSKQIAEILGVSEDVLIYGIDRIVIRFSMNTEIHDMFDRLSHQNQKALFYLVSSLYMEKMAPEIFENGEYYAEE